MGLSLEPDEPSLLDNPSNDFQELTLDDELETTSKMTTHSISKEHNIYKVARSNKAKVAKSVRIEPAKTSNAHGNSIQSPNVYTPVRNGSIFAQITNLYDQFLWKNSVLSDAVSRKCANDMAVYLKALEKGQSWALKGLEL